MIWEPFAMALVLGLAMSAGLYFAYLWPSVEPDDDDDTDLVDETSGDTTAGEAKPKAKSDKASVEASRATPDAAKATAEASQQSPKEADASTAKATESSTAKTADAAVAKPDPSAAKPDDTSTPKASAIADDNPEDA